MHWCTLTRCTAIFIAIVSFAVQSHADQYPTRPIRIIVPFAPGGLNDTVARILQPYLQDKLGQTIIVENRPGASGMIGTDLVAKAAPDGYTLLVVASSHTVIPATRENMPYDADRSFAAVSLLARDPLLFVVGSAVPARTLAEFVALAKSAPNKLNYVTLGSSSQSHFLTELFCLRAGIEMLEVPYRGGSPVVLSLTSGETQFAILSTQQSLPQIKAGKLRALASGSATRSEQMPNLPTLSEAGFPGIEALQWVGMLAPAKTPKDVLMRLNTALREALASPAIKARLAAGGMTTATTSPEEFQMLLTTEIKHWRDLAQTARVKPH